ncbi:hypothetical protein M408DRAFT_29508 [Serendipita vermifera MAFF 305830]|uniref:DUF6535 domain-containing protein n=1 Tax=Serendipita vermifera MAFF 305830 TaxID=933852 RepID=A0A0C3ANE8_SERVB|nr:hypothetical protein M408DRAFT_29508 [Serendipita vermifera MAFF 305830]
MAYFSASPRFGPRNMASMHYTVGIESTTASSTSVPLVPVPVPPPTSSFAPASVAGAAPRQPLAPIITTDTSELNIWDIYTKKAALADGDIVSDFNSSMDVLLVFAGLFSAVNTAFIIETYKLLKPDQSELTNQLLYAVLGNQSTVPSSNFSAPDYAVRLNTLLFASLVTSLLAALAAMMVKQWAGYYARGLGKISSKQIRARTRQYRHEGIQKWHLSEVVALVPMTLHLSLVLFFIGIIDFLFAVHRTVAIFTTTLVVCGLTLYATANVLPLISSGAPFRSPITQVLDRLFQKIRRGYVARLRSRMNVGEKAGDDAIEDHTDLWFGKDEPQARTVRLMPALDIHAVVWLMVEADKMTEKYLLDMCFEKLMSFRHIAARNPSSFLRKGITRTYRQASNACINDQNGSYPQVDCREPDYFVDF